MWTAFENWLNSSPLWALGGAMFAATAVAAALGRAVAIRFQRAKSDEMEAFVTSSVFGLLALLMSFTFALAIDRFELRRVLVQEEANAIATAHARAQLLSEPHSARIRDILLRFTRNRVALAQAPPGRNAELLALNDRLLDEYWNASAAVFPSIQHLDFSSSFIESANDVVNMDATRKSARLARVPREVFALLILYVTASAAVLGVIARGARPIGLSALFLTLLTLSLVLIIDIDRPAAGGVRESQGPMIRLLERLERR